MDIAGDLLQTLADGIVGLVGGAFRVFGAAIQTVFDVVQSILPGLWLPVVAVVVAIVVFWNLIKR
ncbi:MAG TPA: hypothetical protein VLS28_12730 [Candidatus Sulfomarinibacteraceae bacterium]|nr:hypothetical protein [Candidatus Sulfomarinibacteraceae bacterium]HSO30760.1 hypothetical protein [Candidatus Sulfomarinibacteraceae bacterium]